MCEVVEVKDNLAKRLASKRIGSTGQPAPSLDVAFIFTVLPRYKAWIVESLGAVFGDRLTIIHGAEPPGTEPQDVGTALDISNNCVVRVRYLSLGPIQIAWVPCIRWFIRNRPDVVILIDQVKILSNHVVHLLAKVLGTKVIYYGHGKNHQASQSRSGMVAGLAHLLRKATLGTADGIILYDVEGRRALSQLGIKRRTFIANNTLDVEPMLEAFGQLDENLEASELRSSLGLAPNTFVLTFLGRLIPEKRVGFFLETINALHKVSGRPVHGVIVGDGPDREELVGAANGLPVSFLGYRSGDSLRRLLLASNVVYLPGMVGLAIVEAFCAGRPLLTIDHDFHSPEITYLRHGENGVLIPSFDSQLAAAEIRRLMDDPRYLRRLSVAARETAETDCQPDVMFDAFIEAIQSTAGCPATEPS